MACTKCNDRGTYDEEPGDEPGPQLYCECDAGKAKRADEIAGDIELAETGVDCQIVATPCVDGHYLIRHGRRTWSYVWVTMAAGIAVCAGGVQPHPQCQWAVPSIWLSRALDRRAVTP